MKTSRLKNTLPDSYLKIYREGRRRRKRKGHYEEDDNDEDDDETYHPSQDFNNDSQNNTEFRPSRKELRDADEEDDLEVKKGSGKKLSSCTYVNMLIDVHTFHSFT